MLELDPQNRSLDLVEPAVEPDLVMIVPYAAAMVPEAQQVFCEFCIIGDHHAAVSVAAEILAREEAEAADVAEDACLPAPVLGTKGLCAVLDDLEPVFLGKLHEPVHLNGLHRRDGPG